MSRIKPFSTIGEKNGSDTAKKKKKKHKNSTRQKDKGGGDWSLQLNSEKKKRSVMSHTVDHCDAKLGTLPQTARQGTLLYGGEGRAETYQYRYVKNPWIPTLV